MYWQAVQNARLKPSCSYAAVKEAYSLLMFCAPSPKVVAMHFSNESALTCNAGPPTPQEIRYEAESPDEAALVVAAKVFGFFMIKRTNTTITLKERMPDGMHEREYDVLNLLEFNSTRKRMTVIVKDRQTGRMVLYCKVGDPDTPMHCNHWACEPMCLPAALAVQQQHAWII